MENEEFKIVKSISNNEDDILLGIIQLYLKGKPFELDVTYNVGGLYKNNVPQPLWKSDISPQTEDTKQVDVKDIPIPNDTLTSILFDPPFMFNPHGTALTKNAANKRYTMFETWEQLELTYIGALKEFHRILKKKGIVAFKCQDYTDSKTTMTHCYVWKWAIENNFYPKDLFIRYRDYGPAYNKNLKQKHARKFHSYWFVLEKI